ncbi:uncharacterized protein LOC132741157 [Ruditapes philippinarum]|uniref:uncharacterized protein LOC132741157 n=1 Tax=Ruditapes philippinarum TaxID=129788 RepID=UPI00295B6D20|nr:uncharacterized protein LOC132741157 [Ruditapes philippinarum]
MVLMQTAITDIKSPDTSATQSVRHFLDSGSHRTYITENLARKLHLNGRTGNKTCNVCVNIVPTISGNLHRSPAGVLNKEHVKHIIGSVDLADTLPNRNETPSIEMLVGNDYYLDFILCQKIELNPGLFLLGSKLGWILTGRTSDQDSDGPCMLILTHGNNATNTILFADVDSVVPVKPNLEDFWNVESIGVIEKQNISDDEHAMKMFQDTIQFENGRYQVTWPWTEEFPDLPVNRDLAIGRLKSCVNKLKTKPKLVMKYDEVMRDQLSKGVIEKVEKSPLDGLVHYLPHHAIITPQKTTTKIRVAYDATARTRK